MFLLVILCQGLIILLLQDKVRMVFACVASIRIVFMLTMGHIVVERAMVWRVMPSNRIIPVVIVIKMIILVPSMILVVAVVEIRF